MYRTRPDTIGRIRATLLVTFLVLIIIAQFALFLSTYQPRRPTCTTVNTNSPHQTSAAAAGNP